MSRLRTWQFLPQMIAQYWSNRGALLTLLLGSMILSSAACASSPQQAPDIVSRIEPSSQTTTRTPLDDFVSTLEIPETAETLPPQLDQYRASPPGLHLQSASALVVDERGNRIYSKNSQQIRPIASITKLMTSMVVLDAGVPLDTRIAITEDDRDRMRNSSSRLRIGDAVLTRGDLITAALVSSDNRAAHALGRTTFKGGMPAFVQAMNRKAKSLGMNDSYFVESTGLDVRNQSSAEDLVKMAMAASSYPFIRKTASTGATTLYPYANQQPLQYRNTNALVRDPDWMIELSKTGFINEAGHCLVMRTRIANRLFYIALLHGEGKLTAMGDANRLRDWLLRGQQTAAR